ncbi:class I ribonucleotide reductase maintenance protein YfaE [Suttonella sp. R2A3]|uniref:class I ribonucleotide reductase maintenance protein YfaE n=1 Tax=Suttonella sp. R2A3 TaxID=2908648 RepID=UPI001F1A9C42|nr:class I ribonucleotide reductase maintenance protein YfaE [Suttonella sp. R2A3]UJF24195.1 class I ribonucleotide reductase maintenance protein YfaE [Suttonella sp. R2A3]
MALITTNQHRFRLEVGETLLDGLIRTGHAVEYQCREGYCGSCRVRAQGEFSYVRAPLAYTGPGEVLACCAVPKTDIFLDIDLAVLRRTG